ncbi:MAG: hypothetical protein GX973_06900 [Firmicutes bacterium]|nr:hypothetical protein [Bacillota bacterium]
MFTGGKTQRPAAVIFMLLLLFIIVLTGFLVYYQWFPRIPAPPLRSRPVLGLGAKQLYGR